MKKLKYIMIIALMTGLGLNSCSKDDGMSRSFADDTDAVHINVSINENESVNDNEAINKSNPLSDNSDTRKSFNDGDKITISTSDDQIATYICGSSTWTSLVQTTFIKWQSSSMTFSAFYPANTDDNNAGISTFTLPSDQSTSEKIASADYMTATTASIEQSDDPVDLNFTRKTALINIEISGFGDEYKDSEKFLSDFKIYSSKGDLTTDPADLADPLDTVAITPYSYATDNTGNGVKGTVYKAIVIPSEAVGGESFITLTDGLGKSLTVTGIPEAIEGNSYTYGITIGKDSVSVNFVKINPWNDGSDLTGGDAEDADNIPFLDAAFETAVIAKMKEVNSDLTMSSIDVTNSDQLAALSLITSLDLNSKNITSLHGIEYLTALTNLSCGSNNLSELDISNNTALTFIGCGSNNLSELDVSNNTALTYLDCSDNNLSELDISNNTVLTDLVCSSNNLSELDISNNTALTFIGCSSNNLSELDVSNNTALTYLDCSVNHLSSLDFSNASITTDYYLVCGCQTSAGTTSRHLFLKLSENQQNHWNKELVNDDFNKYVNLKYMIFSDANFEAAVIAKMKEVNSALTMSSIDITNSDQLAALRLVTSLKLDPVKITSLSGIEYLTALTELDCSGNNLSELDLSKNIALKTLKCLYNNISYLDVSNSTELTKLYCRQNYLSELDISNNTALTYLDCSNNKLSVLDISNNTVLTELNCSNNKLSVLDISNNTVLTELNCSINHLSNLDFSNASITTGYSLFCGTQSKDNDRQNLTLKLADEQKDYWNNSLSDEDYNSNVNLE